MEYTAIIKEINQYTKNMVLQRISKPVPLPKILE